MDDSKFDTIIRKKIKDYEPSGFNPSHLQDFENSFALQSNISLWSKYRTEFFYSTLIITVTMLLIGNQRYLNYQTEKKLETEIIALQNQNQKLLTIIDEYQNQAFPNTNTRQADPVIKINNTVYYKTLIPAQLHTISYVTPPDEKPGDANVLCLSSSNPKRISPRIFKNDSYKINFQHPTSTNNPEYKLSSRTLRKIEKHYYRGIGIKAGPDLEISKGLYSPGSGKFDITIGGLIDFIVSPAWSIETGIKYSHRYYGIRPADISEVTNYPELNQQAGSLKSIDIDTWGFEIPVMAKYRFPLSLKKSITVGLGYSAVLLTKQIFEYEYTDDTNPTISATNQFSSTTPTFYPGLINGVVGLNSKLKNNSTLETSLFYQRSVGPIGLESTSMDILGLRTIYWFNLK